MADSSELKQLACVAIEAAKEELYNVSHEVWANPELCYEEHHAHKVLTNFLEKYGFSIERKFLCDTGFRATFGSGRPHVVVCCEYDALPGIGHACGHNLIAEAGAGAALGVKAALETLGKDVGKLSVFGTPAEEGGAGKKLFIDTGCFKDVDVAMMVHPVPLDKVDSSDVFICSQSLRITYRGKASHAAGFPWEGINALDAAVMAYTSISCLRQQLKPDWRIHGIFTNGGAKPNIIPEESELEYMVRTPTVAEMAVLSAKATACFEAAATATGCQVEIKWTSDMYYNVISNKLLGNLFEKNANQLGLQYKELSNMVKASTDMGNVSYVVPSIHPLYAIPCKESNHNPQFTEASGSPDAQGPTLVQTKAMAMTALDVFTKPDVLNEIKAEFIKIK